MQGAAGRDAAWAGGVGIAVACPQGCQVIQVWRLYIGMACNPQTVAAHLVGHDEQDVGPVLL